MKTVYKSEGMAFITDSAQKGPNGIIVVDLESGESWRRLHDHTSTKAEELQTFLPIVEGRPFLEHQQNGSVKQAADMDITAITHTLMERI
jgi:Major royal jelly protein